MVLGKPYISVADARSKHSLVKRPPKSSGARFIGLRALKQTSELCLFDQGFATHYSMGKTEVGLTCFT